jgi:VanZ family protein
MIPCVPSQNLPGLRKLNDSRRLWVGIGAALATYAGMLELGQLYVPGRHSQFEDFAASSVGVALVILPAMWIRRSRSA